MKRGNYSLAARTARVQTLYFVGINQYSQRKVYVAVFADLGALVPAFGHAYETDAITDRLVPLREWQLHGLRGAAGN